MTPTPMTPPAEDRSDATVPIVIVGAGGFGREVLDIIEAINSVEKTWDFGGFIDDGAPDATLLQRRDATWLGGIEALAEYEGTYVIGIGDPRARHEIDNHATALGLEPATLVHPLSSIGADVVFGPGTLVTAGVRVTTNIRTGRHVHLHLNSTVGHDCRLEDYVTTSPGANISGNVAVREGVTIGTGAAVIQGKTVGAYATVGAGAVVVRDVEPGSTVVGVPAKPFRTSTLNYSTSTPK